MNSVTVKRLPATAKKTRKSSEISPKTKCKRISDDVNTSIESESKQKSRNKCPKKKQRSGTLAVKQNKNESFPIRNKTEARLVSFKTDKIVVRENNDGEMKTVNNKVPEKKSNMSTGILQISKTSGLPPLKVPRCDSQKELSIKSKNNINKLKRGIKRKSEIMSSVTSQNKKNKLNSKIFDKNAFEFTVNEHSDDEIADSDSSSDDDKIVKFDPYSANDIDRFSLLNNYDKDEDVGSFCVSWEEESIVAEDSKNSQSDEEISENGSNISTLNQKYESSRKSDLSSVASNDSDSDEKVKNVFNDSATFDELLSPPLTDTGEYDRISVDRSCLDASESIETENEAEDIETEEEDEEEHETLENLFNENHVSVSSNSHSEYENKNKIKPLHEFEDLKWNDDEKMRFNSKFYNAIDSRYVLVLLKDRIHLHGTVKLKLIAGSIEIFGYKPEVNETLEIFSPKGYSHLSIIPISNSYDDDDEINKGLASIDPELLVEFKNTLFHKDWRKLFNYKTDALILLERNDRKEIEMIKSYMKEDMFIDATTTLERRPLNTSEIILKCILENDYKTDDNYVVNDDKIKIDEAWNHIKIENFSKIMIIGGKNVGKSTLLRYLINKNLKKFKKIVLIDFDIGQPEIFIPQTITATLIDKPLLGPGYLYSLKPDKSYLYGDTNIVISPIFYLKNIARLINYCNENEEYKNLPWLINTMGYNKGFGSELISIITKLLKPTDIIQIQCERDINNYDYLMTSDTIKIIPKYILSDNGILNSEIKGEGEEDQQHKHRLIVLYSMCDRNNEDRSKQKNARPNEITARDKRYEMMVAHCGRILTGKNEWLTDVVPYVVSIDDINIISLEHKSMSKTDLLDVISGNFVFMCGNTTEGCLECFGLGIVRAVNHTQHTILLLPSISEDVLKYVTTLVDCKIPLPGSILLNQGPKVENIAPYIYTTNNFIASRHIHQIYFKPSTRK